MLPPLADVAACTALDGAMQMVPASCTAQPALPDCLAVRAASRIDIKLLRFGQFEHAQAQKQDSNREGGRREGSKRNRRSFARSMRQIGKLQLRQAKEREEQSRGSASSGRQRGWQRGSQ